MVSYSMDLCHIDMKFDIVYYSVFNKKTWASSTLVTNQGFLAKKKTKNKKTIINMFRKRNQHLLKES